MKTKISLFVALILICTTAFIVPAEAKGNLVGEMDLQFNLAWPGPNETVPDWVGTVTIDGDQYGMAFFNTGTGKAFDTQPSDRVVFFEETWTIYESLDFSFASDGTLATFEPGPVVLSGYDVGVVTLANGRYRMNGYVEETSDEFVMWLDRQVHMSGQIEFYPPPIGAPRFAPGTFHIN